MKNNRKNRKLEYIRFKNGLKYRNGKFKQCIYCWVGVGDNDEVTIDYALDILTELKKSKENKYKIELKPYYICVGNHNDFLIKPKRIIYYRLRWANIVDETVFEEYK